MEKLKDIFHDFSDVLLAITVTAIMYFVFSSSLGSWFNNPSNTVIANGIDNIIEENMDNNETGIDSIENNNLDNPNNLEVINPSDTDPINETVEDNRDDESIKEEVDQGLVSDSDESPLDPIDSEVKTKKIVVPNGTPSSGIAKILKDNGLIEDSNVFIETSEKLNLSVRLKSGSFEIPYNSSIEDMVKIIAGQKK